MHLERGKTDVRHFQLRPSLGVTRRALGVVEVSEPREPRRHRGSEREIYARGVVRLQLSELCRLASLRARHKPYFVKRPAMKRSLRCSHTVEGRRLAAKCALNTEEPPGKLLKK